MFAYVVLNLVRRWPRNLCAVAGIAALFSLVTVITGIVDYQIKVMNEHAAASTGKIQVQSMTAGQQYPSVSIDFLETDADRLVSGSDLQGELSSKILYFPLLPPLYPIEPPQLLLVGMPPGRERAFTGSVAKETRSVEGEGVFDPAYPDGQAILGNKARGLLSAAAGKDIRAGSVVEILGTPMTVRGILEESPDKVVDASVIVPLVLAQDLLDKPGFVSAVILVPSSVGLQDKVIRDVARDHPKLSIVTDRTIARNATEGIKLFAGMIQCIDTVLLVGATLLLLTLMVMGFQQRVPEIGVQKALGIGNRTILATVFLESLALSCAGAVSGGVIAALVLRFALPENLMDAGRVILFLPLGVVMSLAASFAMFPRIIKIKTIDALRAGL
jgi:hypothetical protein